MIDQEKILKKYLSCCYLVKVKFSNRTSSSRGPNFVKATYSSMMAIFAVNCILYMYNICYLKGEKGGWVGRRVMI